VDDKTLRGRLLAGGQRIATETGARNGAGQRVRAGIEPDDNAVTMAPLKQVIVTALISSPLFRGSRLAYLFFEELLLA